MDLERKKERKTEKTIITAPKIRLFLIFLCLKKLRFSIHKLLTFLEVKTWRLFPAPDELIRICKTLFEKKKFGEK
jgi:hypothetical protein